MAWATNYINDMADLIDRPTGGKGVSLGFISKGARALVAPASWNHLILIERVFCAIRAAPGLSDVSYSSIQLNVDVHLPVHVDVDVIGTSVVLSGGDYVGGEFLLGEAPSYIFLCAFAPPSVPEVLLCYHTSV